VELERRQSQREQLRRALNNYNERRDEKLECMR
jgi:hypothetical protein